MKIIILVLAITLFSKISLAVEVNGKFKDECKYLINTIERTFRDIKKEYDKNDEDFSALTILRVLKNQNINYSIDTYKKMCD